MEELEREQEQEQEQEYPEFEQEGVEEEGGWEEEPRELGESEDIEGSGQETESVRAAQQPSAGNVWSDPVLALFNYYRAQGYTDDQIIRGLAELYKQNTQEEEKEEEPPPYLTPEQEVEWRLQKRIEKLERLIEEQKNEFTRREILAYNESIINSALSEFGIRELTEEQVNEFVRVFKELYPTIDTNRHRLTKRQVMVVLKEIFGDKANRAGKQAAAVKQSPAPRYLPQGQAARGGNKQTTSIPREVDRGTRARRWLEL
jgi:hypothetical protein